MTPPDREAGVSYLSLHTGASRRRRIVVYDSPDGRCSVSQQTLCLPPFLIITANSLPELLVHKVLGHTLDSLVAYLRCVSGHQHRKLRETVCQVYSPRYC